MRDLVMFLFGFNVAALLALLLYVITASIRMMLSAVVALLLTGGMVVIWGFAASGHIDNVANFLHVNHTVLYGAQFVTLYAKGHHFYRKFWPGY